MRTMKFLLFLVLAVTPSCAYLTDRAADFLDQYRGVVGVGTGGGFRVNTFGLIHTGFIFGLKPQDSALGWKYGRPLVSWSTSRTAGFEADQSWVFITTSFENWSYLSGDYKLARKSFFLLPAFLTWVDTTYSDEPRWYVPEEGIEMEGDHYIWTGATWRDNRYAMIHAFDVETEISIVAYLDLGFSPGEFLDFLLGLLTIDLAQDDGRLFGGGE